MSLVFKSVQWCLEVSRCIQRCPELPRGVFGVQKCTVGSRDLCLGASRGVQICQEVSLVFKSVQWCLEVSRYIQRCPELPRVVFGIQKCAVVSRGV